MARLAHVGIHVGALQESAVVERNRLAPDPRAVLATQAVRANANAIRFLGMFMAGSI